MLQSLEIHNISCNLGLSVFSWYAQRLVSGAENRENAPQSLCSLGLGAPGKSKTNMTDPQKSTAQKSHIDTENGHILRRSPTFSETHDFWGPPAVSFFGKKKVP